MATDRKTLTPNSKRSAPRTKAPRAKQEASESPSSRDRLVTAALELFYENGFEATGVAEVLNRAKVNSGSMYYFFKNKEELLLAVLGQYKEMLRPAVLQPVFDRTTDPVERIWGILEGYRQMLLSSACTAGCPIGNLALEMAVKSDPVRTLLTENFEAWRVAIRSLLNDAGERLTSDIDKDKMATFVLTTMEGGVMLARTYNDIAPFDDAVRTLRLLMAHCIAPSND